MRQIQLTLLFAVSMLFAACEKPANNNLSGPSIAVTYKNIAGAWELTEWHGEELTEDTYLYIVFDGETRRFEMWDNLGSMYVQHKSGSFTINQERKGEYTLSGQYDNGVGDWNNEYTVELHANKKQMTWYSEGEKMRFIKIDQIPELN